MAVKVMWAPARAAAAGEPKPQPVATIAPAAAREPVAAGKPAVGGGAAAKPRRRKTSIYDADGNEVFITLLCLKCHQMRPLSAFGLRRMADGAIRNQPWCRGCRSDASPKKRKESTVPEESSASVASPPAATPAEPRGDLGNLAAEVATALYRGRA